MVASPNHRPMATAPRDGTIIRLLVSYHHDEMDNHPLEDSVEPSWTIGTNSFDDSGIDEWQLAGWNWEQDCFCESKGDPIGWLPFHVEPAEPTCRLCGCTQNRACYDEERGDACGWAEPGLCTHCQESVGVLLGLVGDEVEHVPATDDAPISLPMNHAEQLLKIVTRMAYGDRS